MSSACLRLLGGTRSGCCVLCDLVTALRGRIGCGAVVFFPVLVGFALFLFSWSEDCVLVEGLAFSVLGGSKFFKIGILYKRINFELRAFREKSVLHHCRNISKFLLGTNPKMYILVIYVWYLLEIP